MIIYNVTIKVDKDIAVDWLHWMKTEHMPMLMETGLFNGCRLCHLLEQDETEGVTHAAQYFCNDIDSYNTYIDKYAAKLRELSFERFGSKFIAFRSLMEVVG